VEKKGEAALLKEKEVLKEKARLKHWPLEAGYEKGEKPKAKSKTRKQTDR